LGQTSRGQRLEIIDAKHPVLSLRRQCKLLNINRSSLYYEANAVDIDDIRLLNEIRDVWERYSFYGYRRITKELQGNGINVNKKRVQRLMRLAGIQAIYPKPKTSIKNNAHATYPYLLKDMKIMRPNQVWMVDITYLGMGNGFVYLVALIDVYSRYIVGWQISTTLETHFCIDALKQGLSLATPEIVNSDRVLTMESSFYLKKVFPWR